MILIMLPTFYPDIELVSNSFNLNCEIALMGFDLKSLILPN